MSQQTERPDIIKDIVKINYLSKDNSIFYLTANGFLALKARLPDEDGAIEADYTDYKRVTLHRAFPFDDPELYISVQGFVVDKKKQAEQEKEAAEKKAKETEEGKPADNAAVTPTDEKKDDKPAPPPGEIKEIGLIKDIKDFGEQEQNYLRAELARKYFSPVLLTIKDVKERHGFSYWETTTSAGAVSFTVQDTYRSIFRVSDDRIIITDIDGNRYEVPSLENFDKKSYKKIELYL